VTKRMIAILRLAYYLGTCLKITEDLHRTGGHRPKFEPIRTISLEYELSVC
jgi:hypothetical protein